MAWGFAAALASLAGDLRWENRIGYRSANLEIQGQASPRLTSLGPKQTGIAFTNRLAPNRYRTNQILLNGSGVAMGDVDGDGRCDLYFCGLDGANVLYRNLGHWRFKDVTEAAGVGCQDFDSTACVLADLDGDRDLDLLVNTLERGVREFQNDGRGGFSDITGRSGLRETRGGMSLALADFDLDGDLDLYSAQYRASALMDVPNALMDFGVVKGKRVITRFNGRPLTDPGLANRFFIDARGGVGERGEPDLLYRNLGEGRFEPVTVSEGVFLDPNGAPIRGTLREWGLSAVFRDLNQDGAPDLYVCNDFDTPDRLWMNDRKGHLRLVHPLALRQTSWFSMGADFADIDRDGDDDFVVLDMLARQRVVRLNQLGDEKPLAAVVQSVLGRPQYLKTTLFLNQADRTFTEIGQFAGVAASDWAWCAAFLDVDLDGWEDLLITNGTERDGRDVDVVNRLRAFRRQGRKSDNQILDARMAFPRFATANLCFRNLGNDRFEEVGSRWGFDRVGVSHGLALGDLDNDGDLDIAVNNLNAVASIYRNDTTAPRVAVRLRGAGANSSGIGARIEVIGGPVAQSQEVMAGGRYLSSDQTQRTFAAGSGSSRLTIRVAWPSGKTSRIEGALPDRLYEVFEESARDLGPAEAKDPKRSSLKPSRSMFQDAGRAIAWRHTDVAFDDFARQPLMPRGLSYLGPGVSWCDLDQDGWDDLVVSSGRGGRPGVFRNDRGQAFRELNDALFQRPVTRDQTAVLSLRDGDSVSLLAGSSNYEDGLAVGPAVRRYDLGAGVIDDSLGGEAFSVGPLALADMDGDGDLDLFAGGRVVPGRYPQPASSYVYRNHQGRLRLDPVWTAAFKDLGLVSGARFTDLNGDGRCELVLACEWGPVRVFAFGSKDVVEKTRAYGLSDYRGWWNGVAAGDFDGDGDMDLVATNWGENTPYQSYRVKPLRLYWGDFDRNHQLDMIQAYYETSMASFVPFRQLGALARGIPSLLERYRSFKAFARASVDDILAGFSGKVSMTSASWLASTVFINDQGTFVPHALPAEAQWAPAFGCVTGDFDGDGRLDLFLSQNFFMTQPETPRYDAGRGLLLLGRGDGGFQPVPGKRSGLYIFGEQRGAAASDFDRDGRLDLAVGQNRGPVKCYRNVAARPGLRVRLRGGPLNPDAIGAQVRLGADHRLGPVHEIHAGSGYLSQDSRVLVMASKGRPESVWVRWPGGKVSQSLIPGPATEAVVNLDGSVEITE